MPRGEHLDYSQIERVVYLLRTTEMEMGELADYLGLGFHAISRINKKYNVRVYRGRSHTEWTVNGETVDRGVTVHSKVAGGTPFNQFPFPNRNKERS